MLDLEFKKDWIAALRSGDYVQGESRLKTNDGKFCCLGVACDLLVKKGIVEIYQNEYGTTVFKMPYERNGDYQVLSIGIASHLGISTSPAVVNNGDYTDIADLNDKGMSFNEIATLIEKQL